MIQHIIKIIWNERKTNIWLMVEYVIIFCILWFCTDYLYTMLRSYYGPQGFDIDQVYMIDMGKKPKTEGESSEVNYDRYALALTFLERVKRHPDVESVALAKAAVPYGGFSMLSGYKINADSINTTLRQRFVSSDFFNVFKIPIKGQLFDWTDNTQVDYAIISPIEGDKFGNIYSNAEFIPISEVHTIRFDNDWAAHKINHKVIGRVPKMKQGYFEAYDCNIILPLKREEVDLESNQIVIRVKSGADKDFVERFTKDMREQLFIGPYYLSSIVPITGLRKQIDYMWGARDQINSTCAITFFLMINIFLGILGSFWFRTQSRRSEIGLRIALGATPTKVQVMIILETILLLFIASIISTVICLNLSDPEIIRSLGIPTVIKQEWGIGFEQNIINFAITFGFLAFVSILAVWYPAKQASEIPPATALHDE